jgi:2-dehydro-3-deoxygalactonokinase
VTPALVSVDWGTSSFRAYLVSAGGGILERRESARGILTVENGQFEPVLAEAVLPWRRAHPGLPIMMSGMIGSRQGWVEAPYAACPAGADELARKLVTIPSNGLGDIHLVPGLSFEDAAGVPDVIRGEETQIIGALPAMGIADGVFVLPGSHAKWVQVRGGAVTSFRTYMTGEIFAALKGHTILGRLMSDETGDARTGRGFDDGVTRARGAAGSPGRLLNLVFSARTLGLFSKLPPEEISDYLSGLLIGAELVDALDSAQPFTIIANADLSARYEKTARLLGVTCQRAPEDCVVQGHVALAQRARLLKDVA